MITAVDTSILSDVFFDEPRFVDASLAALRTCLAEGRVVACDVVWAESAASFLDPDRSAQLLALAGVQFDAVSQEAAGAAGQAWRLYRARGGSRDRLIPDFLIAAHAAVQADRLLTRDPQIAHSYFPDLELVVPELKP